MDGWDRVIAAVIDRRSELGWTQKRLAQEAGVAERTVQNFEAGKRPQPLSRGKIEKALGWPSGEMRRIASEEPAEPPLSAALVEEIRKVAPAPEDQERVFEFIRLVRSGRLPRREAEPPDERQTRSRRRAG